MATQKKLKRLVFPQVAPGLSPFERSFLESLRLHEHPKASVPFLGESGTLQFRSVDNSPRLPSLRHRKKPDGRFVPLRRGSMPLMDVDGPPNLTDDVTMPRFRDHYKVITKSMKAFDATFRQCQ